MQSVVFQSETVFLVILPVQPFQKTWFFPVLSVFARQPPYSCGRKNKRAPPDDTGSVRFPLPLLRVLRLRLPTLAKDRQECLLVHRLMTSSSSLVALSGL